jgi:flagellar M-ring protein FliF
MAVDDQAVGGGFLGNLPPNVRIAVLVGAVVLVVGLLAFVFMGRNGEEQDDGFRTIYRNLPMAEAGNAKDYLEEEYRIPVKLADNGTSLRVPKDKAEEALVKLAQKNMPGSGVVGYEIFDKTSFISTDFEKRVALQRARDGHLSRLVSRFEGIKDARVNIVIPEPSLFSEEQLPTTASVLLEFDGAGGFKPEYVQAITHLIASATPGLKPGNVTVVDNSGQVLAEGQEGLYGEDSGKKLNKQLQEQIRVKRMMEQQLENKVIMMLEQVLGPGKVKATAEVVPNFDRLQQRARRHEPVTVKDANGQDVLTKVAERIVSEKNASTSANAGNQGAAGAANNTPGQPPAAAANTAGGVQDTSDRTNQQISYNYNNIEELISKQSGEILRKSISVQFELPVIAEGEEAAEGGPPPITQQDVEEMVKKAINYDEVAKDQIFVRQVKFDTTVYDKLKNEMEKAREKTPAWLFVLFGLGGLVVGAGIGGAIMGKKKAAAAEQFAAGVPQYAAIPGAPPPGVPGAPGLPGGEAVPGLPAAPGMPPMPVQQAQEVSRAPIMPPTPDNPFGFLQGVTPQTVAQLLSTERLPTLVAVLAQLEPGQAEDVINLLNPDIQNEVRGRLAQNPVLPPMTQKMVSQSLKKRLAAMSSGVS